MNILSFFTAIILFSQPVSVPNDNLTIIYEGEPIAVINKTDFTTPFYDVPMIDEEKYQLFLEELHHQIYNPPVNATLNDKEGIVSERTGQSLDRQAFTELFYNYFFNRKSQTIEVPTKPLFPEVDSELLSRIKIRKIGQYSTFFNKANKERSHNISLSVEAVNNHVVFPGETFSFNEVVGKRTKEKGYLPAPVIVRGELSEGIGGGICQVSSTLFNAVDNAGVQIIERYSHSRSVPYVPPGRDATVSWYGPDFTFRNKYNQPILIRAKTYGGVVNIDVYSSEDINIIEE